MNGNQEVGISKYPRTPHLAGSRLQEGDDASDQVPLSALKGKYVVLEEKMDAANSGVSFNDGGDLLLQCRGHYLVGGGSERQFNLFKPWATAHSAVLLSTLADEWVMYGEWMHALHSVFYDQLPHYFLEFDLMERRTGRFLSTKRRREMLAGTPVVSVPPLYMGEMPTDPKLLWRLVGKSLAKSAEWRSTFEMVVSRERLNLALCWKQTNKSDASEGLYIKVENEDYVEARYKLVRRDFVQTILDSGSHHLHRPMVPNQLARGVDLYAPEPLVTFESLGLRTMRSIDDLQALSCERPSSATP